MNPHLLTYLYDLPILAAIALYAIRIERRLTRIETDVKWIGKNCKQCQQPSEDNTP